MHKTDLLMFFYTWPCRIHWTWHFPYFYLTLKQHLLHKRIFMITSAHSIKYKQKQHSDAVIVTILISFFWINITFPYENPLLWTFTISFHHPSVRTIGHTARFSLKELSATICTVDELNSIDRFSKVGYWSVNHCTRVHGGWRQSMCVKRFNHMRACNIGWNW